MFRFTASSATSRAVPWLTGRCASCGSSQARAIMATICSGVNTPGQPARGASTRVSVMQRLTSDRQARCSAACKRSWAAAQRRRHRPTVPTSTPRSRARSRLSPLGPRPARCAPVGPDAAPPWNDEPTAPNLLLSSAELEGRSDSHGVDVLLWCIVRGGRRGKKGQSGGTALVLRGGQPLYSGGDSPCTQPRRPTQG